MSQRQRLGSHVVIYRDFHPGNAMVVIDDRLVRSAGGFDLAKALEDIGLDSCKFGVVDLAALELHLGFQESLALPLGVVEFLVDDGGNLVQDEPDAAHKKRVEKEHYTRSSFNLMLTKLYGGQGPVYLNVSLSFSAAIDLTRVSNAVS